MKIAVNTRLLLPGKLDGIGWFTYETLRRITKDHPEHTFYFLFDRKWDDSFLFSENIRPVVIPPPARHPLLWHLWTQWGVKRFLEQHDVDLFFSPDGFVPLRTPVPVLPVIHDLNFVHYPDDLPMLTGRYYRLYFPRFARAATHILTVSHYSAGDIAQQYGIDLARITVAYNGVSSEFSPLGEKEKQESRLRFAGGVPYFVHVGSLLPRKNLPRLLWAYELFRTHHPDINIRLVLAGRALFGNNELKKTLRRMTFAGDVHFEGGLGREETRRLIGGAEALFFVSYFEGFGIPLVEAMACHTPVVAAHATALPEVAGEAALFVDPFSVESMADAMEKISTSPTLRQELSRKGAERVKLFSWDQTAATVWKTLEKVLRHG